MDTKMRITWALILLGLLLHCTHTDQTSTPSASSSPMVTSSSSKFTATTKVTITTAGVTDTPKLTTKFPTVATADHTITTAGVTDTPKLTTKVTTVANTDHTIMTAGVTTTQAVTNPTPSSAIGVSTPTPGSSTPAQTTRVSPDSTGTPAQTPRVSPDSSGTPAQTTLDSTAAVTQVSTTTSVGGRQSPNHITSSGSSSPPQPPSTSSPVGSGSSLATTTTSTQAGMVSTTTTSTQAGTVSTTTTSTQAGMVSTTTAETTTTTTTTTTPSKIFKFFMSRRKENHEGKDLEARCREEGPGGAVTRGRTWRRCVEKEDLEALCLQLMSQMQDANCTLNVRQNNEQTTFDSVVISGKVDNSVVQQYYEEITGKSSDNMTLTAILASCGALLAMIVGLAIYYCKSYRKNHRQHLTEELQTVESGYHDNPTLEVMEVQPEMQEKKVALNREFNDSWIVPIDNLLKEDMPDKEDTHL